MAYGQNKVVGPTDIQWVKSLWGRGPEAKARFNHIPSGGMNAILEEWHGKQEGRDKSVASPSQLLTCPRVVWLQTHGVPYTNDMTWATKQRMLLGRLFENQFAEQLRDTGHLLHHWMDDPGVEVDKFRMGTGIDKLEGVPDYLLQIEHPDLHTNVVTVSDAKTSRSDSFGYIGITADDLFSDWGWYKYRVQLTAYYLLMHANPEWFSGRGLPLPEYCHLFSYALDDGVVRREIVWKPTEADIRLVKALVRRFNSAVMSETMPNCTCKQSHDEFDVKFCRYGVVEKGSKVALTCCSDALELEVKSHGR